MLHSLPNLLTLSRIFVIPLFVLAFYLPGTAAGWTAFGLFVAAGATDYLDGVLARRWAATSELGRFLDPIADKLLVASAIVMLLSVDRAPIFPALVILCREILVSGLREFLATLRVSLPVSRLAKWKTAIQFVAISLLLIGEGAPTIVYAPSDVLHAGVALIWLAALITLVTGYDYLRAGLRHIGAERRHEPKRDRRPVGRSV